MLFCLNETCIQKIFLAFGIPTWLKPFSHPISVSGFVSPQIVNVPNSDLSCSSVRLSRYYIVQFEKCWCRTLSDNIKL